MSVESILLSHSRFVRRAIAVAALPILQFSSAARERLPEMMGPRYVNLLTTSRAGSPMDTFVALLISWPMTWVFFKLICLTHSLCTESNGGGLCITGCAHGLVAKVQEEVCCLQWACKWRQGHNFRNAIDAFLMFLKTGNVLCSTATLLQSIVRAFLLALKLYFKPIFVLQYLHYDTQQPLLYGHECL